MPTATYSSSHNGGNTLAPSLKTVGLPSVDDTDSESQLSNEKPGPFHLLKIIDSRARASIHCVRDQSSGRMICWKVVKVAKESDLIIQKHLNAEVQAYKAIAQSQQRCRFLMDCHGVFYFGECLYLAMDYIAKDLFKCISGRRVPDDKRFKWIAQMALGINALHEMGIIHRDIKPENVLVGKDENIRIIDYGSARVHDKSVERTKGYSRKNVSTVQYAAPDCLGGKKYGPMVDYWGLGCIVYAMLTGDALFHNEDEVLAFAKLETEEEGLQYLLTTNKDSLSEGDLNLLKGLLEKKPQHRWGLEEVRGYFAKEPIAGIGIKKIFDEMETLAADDTPPTIPEKQPIVCATKKRAPEVVMPPPDDIHWEWVNPRGIWSAFQV